MDIQSWLPLLLCGLSIPASLFMWLDNEDFSKFWSNGFEESPVIPPTRWLFSTLISLALMIISLKRQSLNQSGATLGVIFGVINTLSNYAFLACLVTFFLSASRATKFRKHIKQKFDKDVKIGEGQRSWKQVLCNGGMATQLAILYLIFFGGKERPIDFGKAYHSSWLCVAVMSALAGCNGDTWASQIATVISKRDPWLITTFKRVPKGTNGGVSIQGLIISFLGGLSIGLSYYLTVLYTVDTTLLAISPPQWPMIVYGGVAGLFGSLIDSVIGAIFQYSGIDEDGKIVEYPGLHVRHISGFRILDDNCVNLTSSIITGLSMPVLALKMWPEH